MNPAKDRKESAANSFMFDTARIDCPLKFFKSFLSGSVKFTLRTFQNTVFFKRKRFSNIFICIKKGKVIFILIE